MKHKAILLTGCLMLSFVITGCASVGNERLRDENQSTVKNKIVEGQTTKTDIQSMFGEPQHTSFTDGGNLIWTYQFTNVSADAVSYIPIVSLFGATASGTKKELVVLFDKNDIVSRYSMRKSDVTQKTGLFNQ